jgi:hypothetical protein
MKIYFAVTKAKEPQVIAAETTYEECVERGDFLARGREFEVVGRYFALDHFGTILNIMEGCSMKHIDSVILEANAHLPDDRGPLKVYLPDELIEHMSALEKETNV